MAIPIITIITDDGTGGGGGGSSTQTCGNGWCEYPENIGSCPQDCLSSGDDGNVTFGVKPPYIRVFGELGQETHCPSENYCSVTIENPNSESIYVYVELNKVTDFETELIDPSYQWASINTIDNPEQVNSLTVMIPGGNAFVPGKKIITVRNEIPINVAETEYEFNLYFVSSGEKHIVRYKTQVGEFNLLAYTDEVFSRILYTQICLPNGKCFNSWVIVSIALAILLLAFYIYIWKKTLEKKKRYKKRR